MKVAIIGAAGRMGKMLREIAANRGDEVTAAIDAADGFDKTWPAGTEAIIDFSWHEAVPGNIAKAATEGVAYVLGTTGLSADEQAAVDEAAKKIAVVQSGNYSLGVNLMLALVRKAAQTLDASYDIEITEMHHRHKKDAPSGTALMLAKSAAAGRNAPGTDFTYGRHGNTGERPVGEIAIHALRGGSVIGDHTVMFAGEVERLEITHKAQTREAFAAGAFTAAEWACKAKPGRWTMQDVLGIG